MTDKAKLMPSVFVAGEYKWHVQINAWTLKQVRELTGVEIGKWSGKDALNKMIELFGDPEKFVDVLYVLCMDQCKERNISDEQFGRSMTGDSIESAADAFYGAFANFCQSQGREILSTMMTKMKTFANRATTLAKTEVESLDVEKIFQTWKNSVTSSQESPELTQEG